MLRLTDLFDASTGPAAFAWLVESAIKGTLILLAAALLALVLKRASAARRHLVWAVALGALALMPALLALLPAWKVGSPALTWVAPLERDAAGALGSEPGRAVPEVETKGEAGEWASEDSPASVATRFDPALSNAPGTPSTPSTPSAPSDPVAPRAPLDPRNLLLAVWAIGALAVLATYALGHFVLRTLLRETHRLHDGEWHDLAMEAADRLRLTAPFALLQGPGVPVPVALGLFRPRVLLPIDADAWPVERRRSVLLHELAHVQRHDCLTQAVAQVACALFWFHPAVWWAAARLRVERERACDDRVLASRTAASDYADHLLEAVRSLRVTRLATLGAVAFARRSSLEGRLIAVLDPTRDRRGVSPRLALPAAALAAVLVLPLSAIEPTRASAHTAKSEKTGKVEKTTRRSAMADPGEAGPSKLVRSETPDQPLEERIAWARNQARKGGERSWWIGWRIGTAKSMRGGMLSDTHGIDLDQLSEKGLFTLDDVLAARSRGTSNPDGKSHDDDSERPAAILLRLHDGMVSRVRAQSLDLPVDFWGEPLYWFDTVPDEQTFAWMRAEASRTQDPRVRGRMVESVGYLDRSDLVVPYLKSMLAASEPQQVRVNAAEALSHHPSDETLRLLNERARLDRDSQVRRASVEAIGRFQTPESLDALLALARADDASAETKRGVFDVLGHKVTEDGGGEPEDHEKVAKHAREMAADRQEARAREAEEAKSHRWKSAPPDERSTPMNGAEYEVQRQAIESLGRYPEGQSLPRLKRIAETSPNADLRAAAVESIARLGTPGAIAVVDEMVWRSRMETPRVRAVEMLARSLPAEQALEKMSAIAKTHPDGNARRMAVELIGRFDDPRAIPMLEQVIAGEGDRDSQRQAVESLGRRDDPGIDEKLLHVARNHPVEDARRQAVEMLGRRGGAHAIEQLVSLAREGATDDVRRQAVESLGRLADPRVKGLLLDLARNGSSEDASRQAVEMLGHREEDVFPELAEIARSHPSGTVRRQAVETMTRRDPERALPLLEDILKGSSRKKSGI